MSKSYAVPGQKLRPDLDAAVTRLEEEAALGRCGVCGRTDPLIRWQGSAFYDGETMTPWMCPACAAAWPKEQR